MVIAKMFLIARYFQGEPTEHDFEYFVEELPPLEEGQFCTEALYLSVDPYMRVYVKAYGFPVNAVMIGGQIARIIKSKNPEYAVGDVVYGHFGWRTHTNVDLDDPQLALRVYKLPNFRGLPMSLGLGVLGMTGNTAYFGLTEICRPERGETVVVSGAAGAVGSHVGQIAKIKGCRVIGFAGTDEKVEWLIKDLQFDSAFNYKKTDISKALEESAPDGVDCYFDNVGGELSSTVMHYMNKKGRVAVCGAISAYNYDIEELPKARIIQPDIILKELKVEGFVVSRWDDRWEEGIRQNLEWIVQEKLKYRESVTEGFENMPKAFIGMLKGENIGKALVKV